MTAKRTQTKQAKKGVTRSLVRRGSETRKVSPPSRRLGAPPDPAVCARCGGVYRRKTWRGGERTLATSLAGVSWTVCPACRQAREGEYFGRVTLRGIPPERVPEMRRRVANIEARARFTQPERRVVSFEPKGAAFEVLTTSQKLAHRIAREFVKLYGGDAVYSWSDRDGALDVIWTQEPAKPAGRAPRHRSRS